MDENNMEGNEYEHIGDLKMHEEIIGWILKCI